MVHNKFKLVVPVYNSDKWIKKCIDSVKVQTYTNYEVIIINDMSTDKTGDIIRQEIKGFDKFKFIDNIEKSCALENTVKGIRYICKNDEDIIVILDGDDWLASDDVLEYMNGAYQEDIWVTWGQFALLSDGKICQYEGENWAGEIKGRFNRRWMKRYLFSHLRTYKTFLFKAIKEEDLRDKDGKYYTTAGDVVIALPLIEMAGKDHRKCVDKLLYIYNNTSDLNDMKVCPVKQTSIADEIRNKPSYEKYKKLITKEQKDVKVDMLVWSKDRACQLDLMLRSIKDNFKNYGRIYVRYDYSNPEFKKGYEKIKNKDYGIPIVYVERNSDLTIDDFEKNMKSIINGFKSEYMVCVCDDDVFIRPTLVDEIFNYFEDDVCAVSLRMSEDIKFCYGTQKDSPLPDFLPCEGNFLKWDWAKSDPTTDWGYPGAVNINIYRTEWYREVIKDLTFNNPNVLECLFNKNRQWFKPYLLSFKKTRILNIPVNQIQTVCKTNPFGKDHCYTQKELNDKWLAGVIIDSYCVYNYQNKGVNEELPLTFKQENE